MTDYAKKTALPEKRFRERFPNRTPEAFFTSPGRTEVIGNHTDHNGGKVLAASITLDTVCAAAKGEDPDLVRIFSEGYHDPVSFRISALGSVPKCRGSLSLVAGLLEGLIKAGYRVGGFDCCVASNVIPSAGVSSSASFEMLIATLISECFNNGSIPLEARARAGQYAENVWWEKASGLMDQMACAHGGLVLFDFHNGVGITPVDFTFDDIGCEIVLVNSGQGHADLSEEYSSIPGEMRRVASACGKENLCGTTLEDVLSVVRARDASAPHDRSLLRALHYHAECARVDEAVCAIRSGRPEALLPLITQSGNSSWKWLQNCYVTGSITEQPVALMLALTELFLQKTGRGACRVNGGGFGGVMMCVLPKEDVQAYTDYMTPYAGKENIHRMGIRRTGAMRLV